MNPSFRRSHLPVRRIHWSPGLNQRPHVSSEAGSKISRAPSKHDLMGSNSRGAVEFLEPNAVQSFQCVLSPRPTQNSQASNVFVATVASPCGRLPMPSRPMFGKPIPGTRNPRSGRHRILPFAGALILKRTVQTQPTSRSHDPSHHHRCTAPRLDCFRR